ncbi:MAG: patatin-like phospholipase family protein [Gemmatimonadetes bacterium]|nr:patatin-like phospholipase family protein [Gemmatimonadota bacterium]
MDDVRYLVLCGGGSRGAIEVGFLKALWDAGIRFDGIVGSSVGAVNGAFIAAGGSPEELAEVWLRLRFRQVFRFNWRVLLRGLRARSLFRFGAGVERLLASFGQLRIENLSVPFTAVATDLATGAAVELDTGLLAEAVRASAAIPGLLPPVRRDRRWLVDGSLSADLPVSTAVARGATEIWAMRCACCASRRYRFDSLTAIVAQTFGMAVDRTRHLCEVPPPGVRAHIWSVDTGVEVPSLNFSMSAALISAAYRETQQRLRDLHL